MPATLQPVGIVIGVVVVVMLIATYLTWLASRLDRLAERVEAVRIGLISQLGARAAAALSLAQLCLLPELSAIALLAMSAHDRAPSAPAFDDEVTDAENALSRALRGAAAALGARTPAAPGLGPPPTAAALAEVALATERVGLARTLYNDAVRDLRTLRARRVVRLTRLAGRAAPPPYFEIDDVLAPQPTASAPAAGSGLAGPAGAGPERAEPGRSGTAEPPRVTEAGERPVH